MKTLANVDVYSHLATERGKIIVGLTTDETVDDEHAQEFLSVKVLSHEKQGEKLTRFEKVLRLGA
jgi:hypothetical protein